MLDAAAAEAERIRLLLLADDFRERALYEMMHGVLEIRWEDTIKRDIPKPKFMLEKPAEEWNEDEIRASFEYEERVTFLMSERQRYKNMLEAEYGKIKETVNDTVRKFNSRLRDLLLLKLKVEAARKQQILRLQNRQLFALGRMKIKEKETACLREIKENDDKMVVTVEQLAELRKTMEECKAITEVLLSREKQLEKYFKRDFAEFSNLIQNQAMKLYK